MRFAQILWTKLAELLNANCRYIKYYSAIYTMYNNFQINIEICIITSDYYIFVVTRKKSDFNSENRVHN